MLHSTTRNKRSWTKDRYTVVGEHSTNCYAMNGVKPTKHYDEGEDKLDCDNTLGIENKNGTNDITVLFKKRCAELALEKIWLTPMKYGRLCVMKW